MRQKPVVILATAAILVPCSALSDELFNTDQIGPPGIDFQYLSVSDRQIETLHELRYAVAVAGPFKVTEPKSRTALFNKTPYKISMAAFISDASSVMIHAEKVADSSGASNYSHLPLSSWPDGTFRSGGPACVQISSEETADEHDLQWLHENGFDPTGNLLIAQYFATTTDMNSELVISLLKRVPACGEMSAIAESIGEFLNEISVTRIE